MKDFILKVLVYSIPIFIVGSLILIIDPNDLFHKRRPYNETKEKIVHSYDQSRRYKINRCLNEPTGKIILGASEIGPINENNAHGWQSLSFGGAMLEESMAVFWEIIKYTDVKSVIFAPEFIKYYLAISQEENSIIIPSFEWKASQSYIAFEIYNNPLNAFNDKYTLLATKDILMKSICDFHSKNIPNMSKLEFWKSQMYYANQVYNHSIVLSSRVEDIKKEFIRIKEYCNANNIDIKVTLPLQHVDLLQMEYQEGVYEVYVNYLETLVDIFDEVYYFSFINGYSEDSSKFTDPFHYTSADLYLEYLVNGRNNEYILNHSNCRTKLSEYRSIILKH